MLREIDLYRVPFSSSNSRFQMMERSLSIQRLIGSTSTECASDRFARERGGKRSDAVGKEAISGFRAIYIIFSSGVLRSIRACFKCFLQHPDDVHEDDSTKESNGANVDTSFWNTDWDSFESQARLTQP